MNYAVVVPLILMTSSPTMIDDRLMLGTVIVRLGTTRIEALAPLRAAGYVIPSEKADLVFILERDPHGGKTVARIGSIKFVDGIAREIRRPWLPTWGWETTPKDIAVGDAFYGVVKSLRELGYERCTIGATEMHDPEGESRNVIIDCGRYAIEFSVIRSNRFVGADTVDVEEVLR